MLTEIAINLIKELNRSKDSLPPFNAEDIRNVLKEINTLYKQNRDAAQLSIDSGDKSLMPLVTFRHAAINRNKRCLLAYLYNRLQAIKKLRWDYGPVLPDEVKENLCEAEIKWYNNYSNILGSYMRSISDGIGINLTEYQTPPKSLYVEVRCLNDYGKFELENGEVVMLRINSQHYLPRNEVDQLIRQGILEHIV